jgi:hypothetical protein
MTPAATGALIIFTALYALCFAALIMRLGGRILAELERSNRLLSLILQRISGEEE